MKKIAKIILVNIILILTMSVSYAAESLNTILNATSQQLYAEDTVVFKVKLDNLNDIKHGVNAYKATLLYDDNIFEKVSEIDFKTTNDWEGLRYNPDTGEFVVYKRAGITDGEDIVNISLKVKENAKASKTEVKLVDAVASEGKKDLFIQDTNETKVNIDIIEEQKEPDDKPVVNPDDNNEDNKTDGQAPNESSTSPNTGDNFIWLF